MNTRHELPTGTLHLGIRHADLPAETLFAIGARANPKRGFLFVSKILGKHWPVDIPTLARIHEALAAKLPAPCGKTLFIGMAETATALAQGVFEARLARYPEAPALYLHTSRLRVAEAEICPFEESHSHAANQWLHLPAAPLADTDTLILIDDELSTGNTFRALQHALAPHLPKLRHIHWLCATDFSPPQSDGITRHSLLQGQWQFSPAPIAHSAPAAQGTPVTIADSGFGRLGINRAVRLPDALIPQNIGKAEKILVIGTGEFIHPPAVFARKLQEASGAQVFLQSSTRSPALVFGAITHKRAFADPYGEGVPYYLYNVEDGQYDRLFICHEHPANAALMQTAAELGATLIHLRPA